MRRRIVIWVSVIVGLWAVLALGLYLVQDGIVFPGAGRAGSTITAAGVEEVRLDGPDGMFRVAQVVPENPSAVMLFFVGNGEDLTSAGWRAAVWSEHGLAAVCPEYPGYGDSEGRPGVASLLGMADSAAVHAARLAEEHGVPLVVGGISLGSCCAVHVAAQGIGERLFLAAPMTSMLDVAGRSFWWLPIRWMLRHGFDNMAAATKVSCPVFVLHGSEDRIIPIGLGRRLFAEFPGQKEFLAVTGVGGGHNSLSLHLEPGCLEGRLGRFLRGE